MIVMEISRNGLPIMTIERQGMRTYCCHLVGRNFRGLGKVGSVPVFRRDKVPSLQAAQIICYLWLKRNTDIPLAEFILNTSKAGS